MTFQIGQKAVFAVAFLLLLGTRLAVLAQCTGSDWTGTTTLDSAAEYTVQHKVEGANLVLRLRAKTNGFLGFGLSEAGHMMGSDIVTAAMVGGQPRVEDRFSEWTAYSETSGLSISTPKVENCQQWTALCGAESGGYSEFILQRPLLSSDPEDRNITSGDHTVIFAWGETDNVEYHGSKRGTTMINFYRIQPLSAVFTPPLDATSTVDLTLNNYVVESRKTLYVLQKFDLGATNQHIVAVEMIVRPQDADLVHHVLVHDCGVGGGLIDSLPTNFAYAPPTPFSPLGIAPCTNMIFGWAKGGGPVSFPSAAGFRTGSGGARIVVLEFHVDNPSLASGRIVASGVRLHLASTLRPNDIGTIVLGNAGADLPSLPQGQARIHLESTCPAQCLQQLTGPIIMFRSFLHMHSYGREMWTTIYRASYNDSNGNLVTPPPELVASKQFWSFEFQNQIEVNVTVNTQDRLSTHCVYDTTRAPGAVSFGTDSSQEMCMDFIMYYPRANFNGLGCGRTGNGQTKCKASTLSLVNPIPDGAVAVPDTVSVGGVSPCQALNRNGASASQTAPLGTMVLLALASLLIAMAGA